ncbi:MAG: serine/threonine-protein kinase PknK, partial [bacterium]|nr:serine/threonine-protein kinase PknK [bacterium]
MIEIAGYQVTEKIYESRRTEIYRGISEKDNKQVIFKTLKNEYPSQDEVASLNNEYKILNILRNPGIIQAFALEKYNNRPVIIMEDFGGKSIKELLNGKGFDTEEFLQIAIDLAGILGEIHNKDIIHKDINLANILLNPETNQVKIIDFNIATRLSRENLAIVNPDRLEGTLPYISPEQTGRMNRSIDYRSDFYSLGVTFYSMLTGKLPFESDDPMELVHSHIARKAVSPHELDNEIWEVLSDIIMTLMQKNAENRYQTAYGLQDDLDQCYKEFKNNGIIGSFEIGKNDISDKFQIPEKLYGRKEEIEYLISTFNNIANGKKDIILFAGLPGIGKSALIHEVHKPIVEKRGYFLPGKFDKYQKNIPYSGIIQSFKELFKQLLTERKVKMEAWKDDILEAVGNMGKVITDVIDEVEAIIGKQPDVEQLPPEEAQNRFNMVFQSFIKVFAKQEHPLVLFLDDLQWADNPSLQLLQILLTDNELKYFLFIGAYRDNEVDSGHPFMLTLDAIKKEELRWNLVELGPIRENYINRMIADSLYCDSAETTELTELVASKTGGNPFFIKQFLKTLVDDNLVIFVHSQEKTRWTWDIARIQQADITDNVVELVAGKIERLESETWRVMKTACCIGVTFSHELLANCHEKSKADIEEILQSAINEGMIIKIADIMKFAHDRVQEAAYSLISAEDQVQLHYKIGETLLKDPENLNTDAAVFNIADQLNKAKKLLNEEEKKQLIDIDIKAGMISKMSAAYDSSVNFLRNGVELLPPNPWKTDYDTTFLLYLELSEAEYLATNFEEAEKIFNMILHNAKTILDKSKVYSIKVRFHATQKNRDMALKVGLDAINQLGVPIPSNPGIGGMLLELAKTKLALGKKKPADLINLPEMKDEKMIAAINLMM